MARPKVRLLAQIEESDSGWTVHPILLGDEAALAKRFLDDNGFELALEVPMESVPEYFQGAIKTLEFEPRFFLVVWQEEDREP
jgi:hypothetical protein